MCEFVSNQLRGTLNGNHVRTFFFLCGVMTFLYYVMFIRNVFTVKRKAYYAFRLPRNFQHGRCLSAEHKMSSRQIRSCFLDAFHTRDKLGLMKNFMIVNNFCFSWKSVGVQLGTLTENVHIGDCYQCVKFHSCIISKRAQFAGKFELCRRTWLQIRSMRLSL